MRKLLILAGTLALSACAGPTSALDGAPSWVVKGNGAYPGDHGKIFRGVGISDPNGSASMARTVADTRARAEIASVMNTYVERLVKAYQESTQAAGQTQNVGQATDALKSFTKAQLSGAEVVDHWISKDGTTYSLAELDFTSYKDSVGKANEMSNQLRDAVKARADSAFDELNKESEKH